VTLAGRWQDRRCTSHAVLDQTKPRVGPSAAQKSNEKDRSEQAKDPGDTQQRIHCRTSGTRHNPLAEKSVMPWLRASIPKTQAQGAAHEARRLPRKAKDTCVQDTQG